MRWNRIVPAALVGGIAMWLASFVLHGIVMADTYVKYPEVFTQKQANPFWFLAIEFLIALPAAVLFSRTRSAWPAGIGGGAMFGFWVGAIGFFAQFFFPLVIEGFPYYLGWCWGGINLIVSVLLGAVLGVILPRA
jgi:hypothetical protein